jgi:hypothetical protein
MAEAAAIAEGMEMHHIGAELGQQLSKAGDGGGGGGHLLVAITRGNRR